MNLFTKRFGLVLAGVIGVGAIASLAMGASFALFSATISPSTPVVFTAGTVSFSTATNSQANPQQSGSCNEAHVQPGDSSNKFYNSNTVNPGNGQFPTCQIVAHYTGNVAAYVGVQISVTSTGQQGTYQSPTNQAGPNSCRANSSPATGYTCDYLPLVNGVNSGAQQEFELDINSASGVGEQITMSALHTSCTNVGTVFTSSWLQTCTSTMAMPYLIGNTLDNLYGNQLVDTVGFYLPQAAGNMYQGSSATVSEMFAAVQCANNGATGYVKGVGGTPIPQATTATYQNVACAAPGPAAWS
ncbi:MAG: hypothetical protein ACYCUD_08445 [Candidatus Dormibacteria bacterium]